MEHGQTIHAGQYAFTKDGRIIYIKKIIDDNEFCGVDINKAGKEREVKITYKDVEHVVDEICKNVIVK